MYKCDQLSLQEENLSLEEDSTKVESLLRETFTFEKIVDQSPTSVTVRVTGDFPDRIKDQTMALKITNDMDSGIKELRTLCEIKNSILDPKLSPCFLRCDNWVTCVRLPEIDQLGPSSLSSFSADDAHLYMLINTSDYTLANIPYQPTQYQVKCLIFELLYAILIGRKHVRGINIREDNIFLTETQIDRLYTVGGKQFRISSEYLPIFTEFTIPSDVPDNAEISALLQTFAYFMNSKVDLSELLVSQFENLTEILSIEGQSISHALENSTLFDDLNLNSTVSQSLQRDLLVNINVSA